MLLNAQNREIGNSLKFKTTQQFDIFLHLLLEFLPELILRIVIAPVQFEGIFEQNVDKLLLFHRWFVVQKLVFENSGDLTKDRRVADLTLLHERQDYEVVSYLAVYNELLLVNVVY